MTFPQRKLKIMSFISLAGPGFPLGQRANLLAAQQLTTSSIRR
jgi:hypothetical protein